MVKSVDCNVNFLVLILYYSYVRCYHWGKLGGNSCTDFSISCEFIIISKWNFNSVKWYFSMWACFEFSTYIPFLEISIPPLFRIVVTTIMFSPSDPKPPWWLISPGVGIYPDEGLRAFFRRKTNGICTESCLSSCAHTLWIQELSRVSCFPSCNRG